MRALDDPSRELQPFFTGSRGTFSLPDLDPGRYRIELRSQPWMVDFVVPETEHYYPLTGSLVVRPIER